MGESAKTVRSLTGTVVSNKMDKSIAVTIQRTVKHPLYGKYIRRTTKLLAHDENNECNIGDTVIIEASRPVSKNKAWRLRSVVSKAQNV
ncbi:MAG: 30S ribosomal protein S17 [Gammaproteobacteria bacterium]|nr:30S ribosomal protein S17 [Gammaproteobacteria bacterium]MCY4210111.1 30S ribosomal protein S17 [Gammaproteobacteria bacterium]MCY4282468.1 30S ribosomal protein S17 [Gammaproteobacteria bacterium]MCY4338387.1 30S ribosomal protein S17 [Gammaproteobacteria bacterium]